VVNFDFTIEWPDSDKPPIVAKARGDRIELDGCEMPELVKVLKSVALALEHTARLEGTDQ
jgi:hypothetical protein